MIFPHRAPNSRTCRQEADGDQVQIWLKAQDFKAPFLAPLGILCVKGGDRRSDHSDDGSEDISEEKTNKKEV